MMGNYVSSVNYVVTMIYSRELKKKQVSLPASFTIPLGSFRASP